MATGFYSPREKEQEQKTETQNEMRQAKRMLYGVSLHNLQNQFRFKDFHDTITPFDIFKFNRSVENVAVQDQGVHGEDFISLYKYGKFFILGNEPIEIVEKPVSSEKELKDAFDKAFNSLKFFYAFEPVEKYIKNHFNLKVLKETSAPQQAPERQEFALNKEYFPSVHVNKSSSKVN